MPYPFPRPCSPRRLWVAASIAWRWPGSAPDGACPRAPTSTAHQPYLLDVMCQSQQRRLKLLMLLWLVSLASLWGWWLRQEHIITTWGMVVNSFLLVWATLLPAWYFYFVGRMKQPNPHDPLPEGAVAMVVTKAPTEPWTLVRTTLTAMLAQEFPRQVDVWLADEDPSIESLLWCIQHRVKVSSRKYHSAYHKKTWPRRERCKEGNLAYFYDHWGYKYDFVIQMDADHAPSKGYLREMVRPFADSQVGYVAAPSICDANYAESWTVRARLFAEGSLHGSLQAGYNSGFAPLCIGSHYAVRTKALREIGGLGPELAEDHSTTLMFNAYGWKGVFAFQAEASGEGAGSVADAVTQEFQWARSLTNILLRWTPRYWTRLPTRLKFQFGFAQLWYPMFALHLSVAHAFPLIALATGQPWVSVSLPLFLLYSFLVTLSCLVAVRWIQGQGWFRPSSARVISWEMILFQFVRWPWILLACVYTLVGSLLGREFSFKVTPKKVSGAKALPFRVLTPYLGISVLSAGIALAVGGPGEASGYYYFALLNGVVYLGVALLVVTLHYYENYQLLEMPTLSYVGIHLFHVAVTAIVVGLAFMLRWEAVVHTLAPLTH
jgi:cellulose synthase (UDP-forming)